VSVKESEILTLYSEQDIDGWFEGVNSKGERGLFPASYVEILRTDTTSTLNNNSCSTSGDAKPDSRYANIPPEGFDGSYKPQNKPSQGSDDDWDDDWDDSSTVADEPGTVGGGYHDFA
ncbi:hypothetical protein KUCAC02_029153, partial [Chaenocephalus aceratus]